MYYSAAECSSTFRPFLNLWKTMVTVWQLITARGPQFLRHEDPMVTLLHGSVCLLVAPLQVDGNVLRHGHIREQLHSRKPLVDGFLLGEIHQQPAQTGPLSVRRDCEIAEAHGVTHRIDSDGASDPAVEIDDIETAVRDGAGVVPDHGCGFQADAGDVMGVSILYDLVDDVEVIERGTSDVCRPHDELFKSSGGLL